MPEAFNRELCVRVGVGVCGCACVWLEFEQKPRLYINQATIFSDPNALLCAYFLFFAAKLNIQKMSLDLYIVLIVLLFTGTEDCCIARLGQLIFSH